ncbi:hypothetical protein MAR_031147 [Mya arenaria]|uniref:Uncharacterized protein n=1 Tax=Mya arenaria TaxID=6604 RepID=A0ABY7F773_MYAAR|nr:hypothetical protein MAR_031147 [Mya arenaria]
MSKSLPVLALFLTLMGGVFIVIGLATPNWITRNSGQFHQGLWKYCANNNPCLKLERGPVCFTMSGILLYAAKKNQGFFGGRYDPNEYDFGWSFSLTAVGGVLMFGNAVILAIQLRKNTKLGTGLCL